MKTSRNQGYLLSLLLVSSLSASIQSANAGTTRPVGNSESGAALLPTGQIITPAAAPGSTFAPLGTGLRTDNNADAAEAVSTALSPDGKIFLVLTSGYNQNFNDEKTGSTFTYPVLDPLTGKPIGTTTPKAEWFLSMMSLAVS